MFFYLPALAAIHFTASAAFGAMSVLSAKALYDMRKPERRDGETDRQGAYRADDEQTV